MARFTSSSDTFAGIRNSLNERRTGRALVPSTIVPGTETVGTAERNTCMVWDYISANTFILKLRPNREISRRVSRKRLSISI